MKKTLKFFGLLLISATLISCELDDVTLHAELEIVFHANEEGDGISVLYQDLQILDLADNPEIAPHLDKINNIEITRVTYRITGYDEDETADPPCTNVIMTDGFAKFGQFGTLEEIVLGSFAAVASSVNLQTTTSETDLDIDADQFNALADLLLEDQKVNIYSVGTLSCTPIKFDVVAKFYATVTADAVE